MQIKKNLYQKLKDIHITQLLIYTNQFLKAKTVIYLDDVTFDEIYALFEFNKRLKNIILKYCLEIETVIKSIMANQISKVSGVKEYLKTSNWDNNINDDIKENPFNKINTDRQVIVKYCKISDKEYIKSDNITNLYMVIRCMENYWQTNNMMIYIIL